MHEDECEERQSDHRVWRGEINFPDPSMANHFNEWWQNEGWRSFRDWHDQSFGANSEWERFMSKLCGPAPDEKPARRWFGNEEAAR